MIRTFTSDLKRNITKTVCLTLGLAIGFLLVAKVYFEQTYDAFLPDSDRIFMVTESAVQSGEYKEYEKTPGAIAPGIRRYSPQVESATRSVPLCGEQTIRLDDGRQFEIPGIVFADSCWFDVLKTNMTEGNPHEALAVQDNVMIPRSLAEKIGGEVKGLRFCVPHWTEDYIVTIGGVYEDYPLNSTIKNLVYLSMPTIGKFRWDGTENWMGNDSYSSYLLLHKGAKAEDLRGNIDKMIKENLPDEAVEVFKMNFGVKPLVGNYTKQGDVRTMSWMLILLAVIILMSSGLNYLLVVIGQMGKRGKEMAVRKCYGTSNSGIFMRVMGESMFFLLLSFLTALVLVMCFSETSRQLLGFTPRELFSTGNVWIVEGCVFVVLSVITGVIPSWIYCRTPVANAFRPNVKSRRGWKLALLSIQFFSAGLLMSMLVLVGRQYMMMSDIDMGIDYKNLGIVDINSLQQQSRKTMKEELGRLGCVAGVASAYQDFVSYASGNNIWIGDDEEKQVNVGDLYYADREIVATTGMKLLQGRTFREDADSLSHEVIVEERFIDVLKKYYGVKDDNIIGKRFHITEHIGLDGFDEFTIVGVIGNLHRGGFFNESTDNRAGVIFPARDVQSNLYIRFNRLTPESMKEAQAVVNKFSEGKELYIVPYETRISEQTETVKRFGTSVMISGIVIILICMIGLVGYSADEVVRRSKEIAIRKVTGTPAAKIVRLFCKDVLMVALPSLLLGGFVAVIVGKKWLSQFTDQVTLAPHSTILCVALLALLTVAVIASGSLSVARRNPVDHLRSE